MCIFIFKLKIRPQEKLFSRHFLLKHNQKVSEVSTETSSRMMFSGFKFQFSSSFTFRAPGHLLDALLTSQFHHLHFPVSQGLLSALRIVTLVFHNTCKFYSLFWNRTQHMVKMKLITIRPEQRHSRNCRPGCYKSKCILLPLLRVL